MGLKKNTTCCICWVSFTPSGLISPGAEGQGMGQDLKFSSSNCCCLKMRKNPICSLWAWPRVFLLKCHHTPPPSLCSLQTQVCRLRPTWLQCARAQSRLYSHREPASSFSFSEWIRVRVVVWLYECVFVCACASETFQCMTSTACCLLTSSLTPTTRSAAVHSDTLVLYLSSCAVRLGLRLASGPSEMTMWRCHAAADMLWCCARILSLFWMNSN